MPTASASPQLHQPVAASVVAGCLAVPAGQRHRNDQTGQRLESVAATLDGFELARLDLSQRREGDILGAAQHGSPTQLEFLHVLEHEDLIEAALRGRLRPCRGGSDLAAHPDLKKAVDAGSTPSRRLYPERG